MSNPCSLSSVVHSHSSCFQKVVGSKLVDSVLVAGCVALLILGIMASSGQFRFMSGTNASYVSLGLCGGALLCLAAEVIKLVLNYSSKKQAPEVPNIGAKLDPKLDQQISTIVFQGPLQETMPPKGACKITLPDGKKVSGGINGVEAYVLIQAVSEGKCSYIDTAPEDFADYSPEKLGRTITAQEVLDRLLAQ